MAVWIVRGGSRFADAEQDFLESRSVGIYFGVDRNIDGMSDVVLRREIQHFYIRGVADRNVQFQPRVVTFFLNQMVTFRDGIQPGDTIVSNCSRLRGQVGLQSKFRAWLPLCERPDGP